MNGDGSLGGTPRHNSQVSPRLVKPNDPNLRQLERNRAGQSRTRGSKVSFRC